MSEKTTSNADHMPHDIALAVQQRRIKNVNASPPSDQTRFEAMPSNSLTAKKPPAPAPAASAAAAPSSNTNSAATVTSDNYIKAYLEERDKQDQARAEELRQAIEKSLPDKAKAEQEARQKEDAQRRQADQHRYQARNLQNQLQYWRSLAGSGQYDENTIAWNVGNLEGQLNQIPREFW